MAVTYDQDDSAATNEVPFEAFVNDPFGGVYIKSGQDLQNMSSWRKPKMKGI